MKIKRAFEVFFGNLYTQPKVDKNKIEEYLDTLEIANTDEDLIEKTLNAPIEVKELEAAIKKQKSGKAPGPDGYTARFYKAMGKYLSKNLVMVMNKILEIKEIPGTWRKQTSL